MEERLSSVLSNEVVRRCLSTSETRFRRPDNGSTLIGTVVRGFLAVRDASGVRLEESARSSPPVFLRSCSSCASLNSLESRARSALPLDTERSFGLGLYAVFSASGLWFWLLLELLELLVDPVGARIDLRLRDEMLWGM